MGGVANAAPQVFSIPQIIQAFKYKIFGKRKLSLICKLDDYFVLLQVEKGMRPEKADSVCLNNR